MLFLIIYVYNMLNTSSVTTGNTSCFRFWMFVNQRGIKSETFWYPGHTELKETNLLIDLLLVDRVGQIDKSQLAFSHCY